jgi:hypothetical protein
MLRELRCLWGGSMTQHGCLIALLLIFPGGESVADEQPGAPETEPLILQVRRGFAGVRPCVRCSEVVNGLEAERGRGSFLA